MDSTSLMTFQDDGEYQTVLLEWKDEENILSIGEKKGDYAGCPSEKTFVIRRNGQEDIAARYQGRNMEIKIS